MNKTFFDLTLKKVEEKLLTHTKKQYVLHEVQKQAIQELMNGNIIQMNTGEGKSLVAIVFSIIKTLEIKENNKNCSNYLNDNIIITSVNEYLLERDIQEFEKLFESFDISIGFNKNSLEYKEKIEVYNKNIIFSTASEIGFDFLKDNVEFREPLITKRINTVLIDEIDSILIDEANTPLILSEMIEETYNKSIGILIKNLIKNEDYIIEQNNIRLTKLGIKKIELKLGINNLYANPELLHFVYTSLKAEYIMQEDIDYIVKNGKINLIEKQTGRASDSKRFSNGLNEALEVKHNLELGHNSVLSGKITYQNFFLMFNDFVGMSGSIATSEKEMKLIYNKNVKIIDANKKSFRQDFTYGYITKDERNKIAIQKCLDRVKDNPVLVICENLATSEYIFKELKKSHKNTSIVNTKNIEKEAEIIANANSKDRITVATNIAGRGTDIKSLSDDFMLNVIIIGINESVRIDNQARGRSGRQGDDAYSVLYTSFEDDVILKNTNKESLQKLINYCQKNNIDNLNIGEILENERAKIESKMENSRLDNVKFDIVFGQIRDLVAKKHREFIKNNEKDKDIILINKYKQIVNQENYYRRINKLAYLSGISDYIMYINTLHNVVNTSFLEKEKNEKE